jgi:hypothetical protein
MAKTVRVGTALKAVYDGRVRHVIVEEVTDQDNIKVRLGSNTQGTEFDADRVASTDTRGTVFEAE